MKCPKCGYTSFDYLRECKKCGENLDDCRQALNLRMGEPTLFADFDPVLRSSATNKSDVLPFSGKAVVETEAAIADRIEESERNLSEKKHSKPEVPTADTAEGLELGRLDELPKRDFSLPLETVSASNKQEISPTRSTGISFAGFNEESAPAASPVTAAAVDREESTDFDELQLFETNELSAERSAKQPETAAETKPTTVFPLEESGEFELELPFEFSADEHHYPDKTTNEESGDEADDLGEPGTVELELNLEDDESLEDILADLEKGGQDRTDDSR